METDHATEAAMLAESLESGCSGHYVPFRSRWMYQLPWNVTLVTIIARVDLHVVRRVR